MSQKNQNFEKRSNFFYHHFKTHSKTFWRSAFFLFDTLFPKYQHFLALKAHISYMKAELQLPEPCNLILHYLECLLQFESLHFDPCLRNHAVIFLWDTI